MVIYINFVKYIPCMLYICH